MKSWEMIWPAGLLLVTVILAILDAMMRAGSVKKQALRGREV